MRRLVLACLFAFAAAAAGSQAGAQTPLPVDGVYAGTASLAGATGKKCQSLYTFKLRVQNRVFNWRLPSGIEAPVTIGPDGTFSVENGQRFLNGKTDGTHLTAASTGPGCGYNWSFTRE